MKYLSLFSGIGGFEYGIEKSMGNGRVAETSKLATHNNMPDYNSSNGNGRRTNATCIGYSEVDKYAIQIYEKHYDHKNYGDATKIKPKELPDFDLLVGGFPCQAFSIAGKRKGFNDTRGTLFFDIARILAEKKPKYLVLENVKGLLSHDGGKTFQTILGVLTDLGYSIEWQVLNSKNFGVPQNRERVFIVGHLGKGSGSKVFPIGENDKETGAKLQELTTNVSDAMRVYNVGSVCKGISGKVDSSKGIARTLKGLGGGLGAKTGLYAVLTPDRPNKRQNGRRFKKDGEPSFTLTGQDKHGTMKDNRIRRLTPTECERLQGFPDGWTEGLSDTQRYKTLGNTVTTNVVQAVMNKLIKGYISK